MHEALGKILAGIIAKEVQLLYSGCGKSNGKNAKENFSATSVYTLLRCKIIYNLQKKI